VWRSVAAVTLASTAALTPVVAAPAVVPVAWHADVGAQADREALQALAFFPTDVFVNVGDKITWSFDTAEVHTVSFLAPGQTPPPAATAPRTPDNFAFDGTQFVNSGILTGPGTSYSVVFNGTGDFNYLCLIHVKTMTARVHVNPAGSPYPHAQTFYDRQGRDQARLLLDEGRSIRQDSRDIAQDTQKIVTGGGGAQVFVARFIPERKRINVGDTVVWTNPDSITPHTVTFGPAPSVPPAGLDRAGHATISANPVTTTISSGLIGVRRPLGTDFSVTFNAPGTYQYFCSLHADLGMVGTVVVGAADHEDD
jgi:plastocyanin